MTPTDRTLDVLDYLMAAGLEPVKQVDIVRDLGLSPATLNRIVKRLSERGFVFRTTEKYLLKNFVLERTVTMTEAYMAELERGLRSISEKTAAAAEVILIMGNSLLWRLGTGHPDTTVKVRARPGHQRSLQEFDALSKLYLSTLDLDLLERRFDMIGFFDTGCASGREIKWLAEDEVRRQIETTRAKEFICDRVANHQGIRRFVTRIEDPQGRFHHLLAIADSAPPGTGEGKIATACRRVLLDERDRLMSFLQNEQQEREAPVRFCVA